MKIFKGFQNLTYPTYTVICPQTGFTFDVRCLTVSEIDQIKTSITVPAKATSLINKMLWSSLSAKPEFMVKYDDFITNITLRDREALLYGLYQSTFGDKRDFEYTCGNCEFTGSIGVELSKMFSINFHPASESIIQSYKLFAAAGSNVSDNLIEKAIDEKEKKQLTEMERQKFAAIKGDVSPEQLDELDRAVGNKIKYADDEPGKPDPIKMQKNQQTNNQGLSTNPEYILTKRPKIQLPISKVYCVLKQPTMKDEETVMNSAPMVKGSVLSLINETLIIDHFEEYNEGDKVPFNIIENRDDIIFGYKSLPPQDKIFIYESFDKEFGDYGISLKTKFPCKNCRNEVDMEVDIAIQFFRMVASL